MCSFQRTMVLVVCCSWRVVSGRGSPSEPSSLTFDWSGRRSEQPTTGNPQPASIVFGGYKAVVRPVPIPNTAVKRSVADGSACIACARVGSRHFFHARAGLLSGPLLFWVLHGTRRKLKAQEKLQNSRPKLPNARGSPALEPG